MNEIPIMQAFSLAPPRSFPTLFLTRRDGRPDRIAVDWFNWLNMKRQPMLTFAVDKNIGKEIALNEDEKFALVFPSQDPAAPRETKQTVRIPDFPEAGPDNAGAVLICTLSNAYNVPFGKARIFNCNLETAWGGFGEADT